VPLDLRVRNIALIAASLLGFALVSEYVNMLAGIGRTGLYAHNGHGAGWERCEFQQQRKKFWSKRWVEESELQASSLLCSASGLRMRNL
jgi:hypothetical protein